MAKKEITITGRLPVSRQEWREGSTYYRDNIVTYDGSAFLCTKDGTTTAPATIGGSGGIVVNEGWIIFAAAASESVRYTPQALTEEQRTQARMNIRTLSGVTVDLDRLEGVFDATFSAEDLLQGSGPQEKNKAVCDYIMAQLPQDQTSLQVLCARGDYPAFELCLTMTDETGGAHVRVSVYPRLYAIGTADDGYAGTHAICLLPMSIYGNYLMSSAVPGGGLVDYVRDTLSATPADQMSGMFFCYFVKDGSVHQLSAGGAARFAQFKPLYLSEYAGQTGAVYTDAEKERGRDILGCMADDPITQAELDAILKD